LDSLINKIVQNRWNLYVCQNSKGDLIQMDNIVSIEEATAIVSQQSIYGGYRVVLLLVKV
jgi:hypothetical protein